MYLCVLMVYVCVQETSFTPPHVIEMPVASSNVSGHVFVCIKSLCMCDNDWFGVIGLISLTQSCHIGEYRDL
jgi:hypothetical protein